MWPSEITPLAVVNVLSPAVAVLLLCPHLPLLSPHSGAVGTVGLSGRGSASPVRIQNSPFSALFPPRPLSSPLHRSPSAVFLPRSSISRTAPAAIPARLQTPRTERRPSGAGGGQSPAQGWAQRAVPALTCGAERMAAASGPGAGPGAGGGGGGRPRGCRAAGGWAPCAALALGWALGWALGAEPPHRCRPDPALLPPPLRRLAGSALLRAAVPRLRSGWSPCQLYRYRGTAAPPNGTGPCTRGWHYAMPAAGLRSNLVTEVCGEPGGRGGWRASGGVLGLGVVGAAEPGGRWGWGGGLRGCSGVCRLWGWGGSECGEVWKSAWARRIWDRFVPGGGPGVAGG